MADPFDVTACNMSLEDLASFEWVDVNNDEKPQTGEVKFDGEPFDPESDEDEELFECFAAQYDAWRSLMSGSLAPLATPPAKPAKRDGDAVKPKAAAQKNDAGVTEAAAPATPVAAKHQGAAVEFVSSTEMPKKVRTYIEKYFSGAGWRPTDRVSVTTMLYFDVNGNAPPPSLEVMITRGKHSGKGNAPCVNKPSCVRTAINGAIQNLKQAIIAREPAKKKTPSAK